MKTGPINQDFFIGGKGFRYKNAGATGALPRGKLLSLIIMGYGGNSPLNNDAVSG